MTTPNASTFIAALGRSGPSGGGHPVARLSRAGVRTAPAVA